QPFMALKFLRADNQPRSTFTIQSTESTARQRDVLLTFVEHAKPRLIASPDGAPARGSFRIDPTTGRVSASELSIQTGRTKITLRVRFGEQAKQGLWLPTSMEESYTTAPAMDGHATYSNFRQFKVETDTAIK